MYVIQIIVTRCLEGTGHNVSTKPQQAPFAQHKIRTHSTTSYDRCIKGRRCHGHPTIGTCIISYQIVQGLVKLSKTTIDVYKVLICHHEWVISLNICVFDYIMCIRYVRTDGTYRDAYTSTYPLWCLQPNDTLEYMDLVQGVFPSYEPFRLVGQSWYPTVEYSIVKL